VPEQLEQAQAHESRADDGNSVSDSEWCAAQRLDDASEWFAERCVRCQPSGDLDDVGLVREREVAERWIDPAGDEIADVARIDARPDRHDLADGLVPKQERVRGWV
jgi:hypothetical protein